MIILYPGKDSSELEGTYWRGMRKGFEAQVRGQIEVIIQRRIFRSIQFVLFRTASQHKVVIQLCGSQPGLIVRFTFEQCLKVQLYEKHSCIFLSSQFYSVGIQEYAFLVCSQVRIIWIWQPPIYLTCAHMCLAIGCLLLFQKALSSRASQNVTSISFTQSQQTFKHTVVWSLTPGLKAYFQGASSAKCSGEMQRHESFPGSS